MDIADNLDKKAARTFRNDFLEVIRVAYGMDKVYGLAVKEGDIYLPKYEELIAFFNKKYKNLFLKAAKKIDELKLRIFIKEKSIKDVFQNCASRIAGLKAVGLNSFNEADVSEQNKFMATLGKIDNRLFITYYEAEAGSNTIYLEYDRKEKKVELDYDFEGMGNERSPEFKLCLYYGAREYDPKTDIIGIAAKFGFSELLAHMEMLKWMEEFNPELGE